MYVYIYIYIPTGAWRRGASPCPCRPRPRPYIIKNSKTIDDNLTNTDMTDNNKLNDNTVIIIVTFVINQYLAEQPHDRLLAALGGEAQRRRAVRQRPACLIVRVLGLTKI